MPIVSTHRGQRMRRLGEALLAFVAMGLAMSPGASAGPLPAPWTSQDIGTVGLAGSASYTGTTFTVDAAGSDIWDAADSFHFVSQPLTGDGEIVARVAALENTDPWAKAGVMIRESLAANARHALMAVSAGSGTAFQRRLATGGASSHTAGPAGTAPRWVRLVRAGSTLTGYVSADGTAWTLVGSDTVAMAATVYAGLAVTSHKTTALATATLDGARVTASGSLPSPWTARDIGTVGLAGSARYAGTTFTVDAAGSDIWDAADSFHFVSQPLTGDGEIVARVAALENTDPWAKAGVMIRESLAANARHALMAVSAGSGTAFQRRLATGGASSHTAGPAGTAPRWVRLVRAGSTLTGYVSADGAAWTLVGSDTVAMAATVYAGLAVTSHKTTALATATLDGARVTASGSVTPPAGGGAAVTGFTLLNSSGQPIAGFDPFTVSTIDLAALPTRLINFRANVSGTAGSVKFGFDGNTSYRIENAAPYALQSDTGSFTPAVGTHVLTATPYTQANAGGSAGTGLTITFTVTDSGGVTPPSGGGSPGPLVNSPPVTVRGQSGVTIRLKRITSTSGPCVKIENSSNVTVDASDIGPCRGNAIEIFNSHGILVVNSAIHTERSGSGGMNSGLGIYVKGGYNILVQGNSFERNESGVYVREGTRDVRVVGNYFLNPLGPKPRGQHAQFDSVIGGAITDNYGVSELGSSDQEDAINLFKSQNVLVARNYVVGGDSTSGCGIITDGGDNQDRSHIMEDNVLIRTAQCGIGIASGTNHVVRRNRILDTSLSSGGGNTGIYVWNQYPGSCYGHSVVDNIVSNRRPNGQYGDFWNGGNCGSINMSGNIFGSQARSLLTPEADKLPPPAIPPVPYVP